MTSTTLTGAMTIGGRAVPGTGPLVRSADPSTGDALEPGYPAADADQVAEACGLAWAAFAPFAALPPEPRAAFLETIARNIEGLGDTLIDRCIRETGLPLARLTGERGRTCNQLRLFARVVRDGHHLDLRIDPALPERTPAPRPDLRLRKIPLGPVAVFGASNFPLAFSVAGGDTASALAAGCPVVVKAHGAHLGTSELVAGAVRAAVEECGLPGGTFSLLVGDGNATGEALVRDPRIKAVGFTGSRGGGLALVAVAAARAEPIPVHAEMSSINPVLLLDGALAERAERIAEGFVGALTLGAGQFCTNPGLLIAVEGAPLDRFLAAATEALGRAAAATMLTPGIHAAYCRGVAALAGHRDVVTLARGDEGATGTGQAHLFQSDAARFLADPVLQDEVFGAAALLVRCRDRDEMVAVLGALEGQLTVALHLAEADHGFVREILPLLERKAGRIVVNGFGTGVEVSPAMVHGGPFPATSDARTSSVGTLAIDRFLRPVCYQDLPADLLPEALRDANPLGFRRMQDGRY